MACAGALRRRQDLHACGFGAPRDVRVLQRMRFGRDRLRARFCHIPTAPRLTACSRRRLRRTRTAAASCAGRTPCRRGSAPGGYDSYTYSAFAFQYCITRVSGLMRYPWRPFAAVSPPGFRGGLTRAARPMGAENGDWREGIYAPGPGGNASMDARGGRRAGCLRSAPRSTARGRPHWRRSTQTDIRFRRPRPPVASPNRTHSRHLHSLRRDDNEPR